MNSNFHILNLQLQFRVFCAKNTLINRFKAPQLCILTQLRAGLPRPY